MTMDRKQRKEKKREEKRKKRKIADHKNAIAAPTETEYKSGKVQLMVFGVVALAGALLVIFNS